MCSSVVLEWSLTDLGIRFEGGPQVVWVGSLVLHCLESIYVIQSREQHMPRKAPARNLRGGSLAQPAGGRPPFLSVAWEGGTLAWHLTQVWKAFSDSTAQPGP